MLCLLLPLLQSIAIIFHCEFSSERGPRAAKFVRNKVGLSKQGWAGRQPRARTTAARLWLPRAVMRLSIVHNASFPPPISAALSLHALAAGPGGPPARLPRAVAAPHLRAPGAPMLRSASRLRLCWMHPCSKAGGANSLWTSAVLFAPSCLEWRTADARPRLPSAQCLHVQAGPPHPVGPQQGLLAVLLGAGRGRVRAHGPPRLHPPAQGVQERLFR